MNDRIKVNFGKTKGNILLTRTNTTLYLDKLNNNDYQIGETINKIPENVEKLVELNFYNIDSVDTMIETLTDIKTNLIKLSAC